ncbi:MAG: GH25 family lysozyme [Anaerovoracaceae bacterium]
MRKRLFILSVIVIVFLLLWGTARQADTALAAGDGDPAVWLRMHRDPGSGAYMPALPDKPSKAARVKRYCGVDASVWDGGSVNWKRARKKSGLRFAIIRAGYRTYSAGGRLHKDRYFARNIKKAHAAGMRTGAYIFSQARNVREARQEAFYLIRQVKPYRNLIDMPLVMDYEFAGGRSGRLYRAHLSRARATENVIAFNKVIRKAGYTPMIYANTSFLSSNLSMKKLKCPVWVAQYARRVTYRGRYQFWQYSERGNAAGFPPRVDMDYWYTSDLNRYVRKKPAPYRGKVTLSAGNVGVTTAQIKWSPAGGATAYAVFRARERGKYRRIANVKGLSFRDRGLRANTQYGYKVLAFKGSKSGLYSNVVKMHTGKR